MAVVQPTEAQLSDQLAALLERERPEHVVVVTGAGISAESGIPTFRGPEGYWTVGSREYHPQEMATQAAFKKMPREVWRWYLYRKGVCNAAQPNPAHFALAQLERALGDRFTLVTQNVDGLHLIAGNSLERTLQVHGNSNYMRAIEGDRTPLPIPATVPTIGREDPLTDEAWALLVTPDGRRTRPHILWFDEYYEEELYRSESAIEAAKRCELLVVIGTSGAASIPYHVAALALANDAAVIDINPDPNPFADHAIDRARKQKGLWLRGTGTRWAPELVARLT
jgi:NAD-dependent deacetylase